jgi:ArsR family transcriptional regulator
MPKNMAKPKVLTDEALALIADRFSVLSEVVRLKILLQLEAGEKNVSELVAGIGVNQTNVSRHLQTLTDAGIVCRRKEGRMVYYRICDEGVFDLCSHVCGSLKKRFEDQAKAARLFGR